METTELLRQQLVNTYEDLIRGLVSAAPKVVTGIVLVLLAWLIAKAVQLALRTLLVRTRFDTLVGRVGIDQALVQLGLRQSLSEVVPRIAYYLLLFLFARVLADNLGLTPVSDAIGAFLGYVPNVVAALLIVIVGAAIGRFAGSAAKSSAEASGLDFGPSLGRMISSLIIFVSAIMALGQLRIDTDIVRLVTAFSLAGLGLAFGLSFGLGSRTVVGNILAGFYARRIFLPGTTVEIQGQRGTVEAITPTLTILGTGAERLVMANQTLLEEMTRISDEGESQES